jgi:adenosylcobinamide-GDP ribazoletransferase
MDAIRKELGRIGGALSFLTIVPVPGKKVLEGSSAYYPLAGWLIGGVLYGVWTACHGLAYPVRAFIALAVWELLSRGLHVDALADTADAFMAGGDRARILRIMDDSHTGAFGIMAIGLLLIGKFALLTTLRYNAARDALVCAAVMGRYSLTLLCCLFRPAKDVGLGIMIISSSGARELIIATAIGIVPVAVLFRLHAAYAVSGLAVSLLVALYARRKIGGLTGDVLGASLELTELASLFSFL